MKEIFYLSLSLIFICILFISGEFEKAQTKSRQTLLRYRAIKIADYEALYHIHLWRHEPEPRYIYYIGQSKHFEAWYNNIKKEGGIIYRDFEEESTLTNHVFKKVDYDSYSIWNYKEVAKDFGDHIEEMSKNIQKSKKMKKDFDDHIEKLRRKFLNDIQEAEKEKKNFNFEELHKKFGDIQEAVKIIKDFDCHVEELRKKLDNLKGLNL